MPFLQILRLPPPPVADVEARLVIERRFLRAQTSDRARYVASQWSDLYGSIGGGRVVTGKLTSESGYGVWYQKINQ